MYPEDLVMCLKMYGYIERHPPYSILLDRKRKRKRRTDRDINRDRGRLREETDKEGEAHVKILTDKHKKSHR